MEVVEEKRQKILWFSASQVNPTPCALTSSTRGSTSRTLLLLRYPIRSISPYHMHTDKERKHRSIQTSKSKKCTKGRRTIRGDTILFWIFFWTTISASADVEALVFPHLRQHTNTASLIRRSTRPCIGRLSSHTIHWRNDKSYFQTQKNGVESFSQSSRSWPSFISRHRIASFLTAVTIALTLYLGLAFMAQCTTGSAVSHATVTAFRINPSLSWARAIGPFHESKLWTHRWLWLWRSILTIFAGKLSYDIATTQRRQAIDPTSEWTRYAQKPIQRSMAIARLTFLKLMPLILFIKICCRKESERQKRFQTMAGNIFATSLLKLGPLYIKLGQIISSREKLVPKQWKTSMERLQDQVPSRKGKDAMDLADQSWPGGLAHFNETFSDVNWTPLAAASLGQVHAAKLRSTGESVAIKLQRPYLRQIYDQDFVFLTSIATKVDKYFGKTAGSVGGVEQSWTQIFKDAEEILYREIDYRAEAENGVRFCRDFGLTKGGEEIESSATSRDGKPLPSAASWLRAPYVYDNLSTEKVIVMENVPSIKVTASAKLDAANVTAEDREYLADCLGRSYLRQFCCNKFFSTDPHAGNLGVELLNMNTSIPAERVRLVYYDFGQAAELEQNQADGILDIIEAIVDMDVDRSIEAFQEMKVLKENADLEAVRAKVEDNYRTGKVKANIKRLKKRGYEFQTPSNTGLNANSTRVVGSHSQENETVRDTKVMQYFSLPAEYAFVARALTQMDGCGKSLDPEFDFVTSAAPWIYEIKGAGKYLQEEALKWIRNLRKRTCDFLQSVTVAVEK